MRLYRICPERYLENYTGLGGSYLNGGRWNSKGHPVLYFAQSPAVAMLEMANYLPSPRLVPKDYRLGVYDIEDACVETWSGTLPEKWANYPYPASTQAIGDRWLEAVQNVALIVPSAATPDGIESIVLVNARHPDCNKIQLVDVKTKLFNERAFQGLKN